MTRVSLTRLFDKNGDGAPTVYTAKLEGRLGTTAQHSNVPPTQCVWSGSPTPRGVPPSCSLSIRSLVSPFGALQRCAFKFNLRKSPILAFPSRVGRGPHGHCARLSGTSLSKPLSALLRLTGYYTTASAVASTKRQLLSESPGNPPLLRQPGSASRVHVLPTPRLASGRLTASVHLSAKLAHSFALCVQRLCPIRQVVRARHCTTADRVTSLETAGSSGGQYF